jgi:hypothetical protein
MTAIDFVTIFAYFGKNHAKNKVVLSFYPRITIRGYKYYTPTGL